jgi:ubiquinone/menaquinone biosynthesis C-methylase UbiE
MDLDFVKGLRQAELDLALTELTSRKPTGSSIVEIGGGGGWQARMLADAGFAVRSFDLAGSQFSAQRVFPIEDYDGHRIPAADASFDIVFSSNVLEHIPHVRAFQAELHRVLKPDGIAVHLLPTASWRVWTLAAHYPWLVKAGAEAFRVTRGGRRSDDAQVVVRAVQRRSKTQLISRILLSPRHGEVGNAFSEAWHFSRHRWTPLFEETGWRVVSHGTNGLFYTGYSVLGWQLSLAARRRLSHLLGASCHVYVLEKAPASRLNGAAAHLTAEAAQAKAAQ